MSEEKQTRLPELIICNCGHRWYKHLKEAGQNVYECEKCGNDNSEFYNKDAEFKIEQFQQYEKSKTPFEHGSRLPITITIKNSSDKLYNNVPVFNYKNNTDLIYGSMHEPTLEYVDILRLLVGIRYEDEKQIDTITIIAKSKDKENQKEQLINNFITYKVTGIDGREITIPYEVQGTDIEEPSSVTYFMRKSNLFNRCNLLISKIYPNTEIDILIYPTEETKHF